MYVNDKTNNNLQLLYETYTFSSYKNNFSKKIGQITWNAFYPDNGKNGNTVSKFEQFTILGNSGIYNKVTKIIIDFSNDLRKIYFIGKDK